MIRYWTFIGLMMLLFLGVFVLFEELNPSFLADPYERSGAASAAPALIGISLLIADVLVPIPSSLIMISNGAVYGVAIGTMLSMGGALGAALVGFFIGRRGKSVLARFVPPEEYSRADELLKKWGILAIILTRPVPILAETTVIVAGASTMRWRSAILATLAGSLPVAVLYAITGATAADWNNSVLAFGLVLVMAGLFWIVGRRTAGARA